MRRRDKRERLGAGKRDNQPNDRVTRGGDVMTGRGAGKAEVKVPRRWAPRCRAGGPLVSVYQTFVLLFSCNDDALQPSRSVCFGWKIPPKCQLDAIVPHSEPFPQFYAKELFFNRLGDRYFPTHHKYYTYNTHTTQNWTHILFLDENSHFEEDDADIQVQGGC